MPRLGNKHYSYSKAGVAKYKAAKKKSLRETVYNRLKKILR